MSEHTKLPWHENFSVSTGTEIVGPDKAICLIYNGHTEEGYANSHLIVRACNSYKDLRDSLMLFIRLLEHPGMFIEPRDVEKAKAAIEKARKI